MDITKQERKYTRLCFVCIFLLLFSNSIFAQSKFTDAIQMLEKLNGTYPALQQMLTGFCYLAGFAFIFRGIFALKVYGEMRTMQSSQTDIKIPVVLLVVGCVFIYIPSAYSIISTSFFGDGSILKYDEVNTSFSPEALRAITGLVSFIGFISFIKGWMILVDNAQHKGGGQASFGKAVTHIVGGLMAINILGMAKIVWNTFGFSF